MSKQYSIDEQEVHVVEDLMHAYEASPYGQISPALLMSKARAGLSMSFVHDLCTSMDISLSEMSTFLHVSLRTLQRYSSEKVLDIDQSSKLLMLSDLYLHGVDVMPADQFRLWLREELPLLGGEAPLTILDNPFGIKQVSNILGQLEHGVFA